MIIHQIYGLFRDGKSIETNDLFVESRNQWRLIASNNNYEYKLWDNDSCNELINKYPEFIELYNNVKYPVMRADIMRFLILYDQGGLYVDLDVLPLKSSYNYDKFSVCRYYYAPKYPQVKTDMEIIYSNKGNIDLYNFIKYIEEQIVIKDKIDIYKSWKIRYVFQTTGPMSFNRFLKLKKIQFGEIKSNLSNEKTENIYDEVDYDVVSKYSMSYK